MPEIRRATAADAAIITHHRRSMFEDMGGYDPAGLDNMARVYRDWIVPFVENGSYIGMFMVEGDEVLAGGGLWVTDWSPQPTHHATQRGYLLNVYTEQAHRRRGYARQLVQALVEEAHRLDLPWVDLHASDEGRSVYEALGFVATNEMRLRF